MPVSQSVSQSDRQTGRQAGQQVSKVPSQHTSRRDSHRVRRKVVLIKLPVSFLIQPSRHRLMKWIFFDLTNGFINTVNMGKCCIKVEPTGPFVLVLITGCSITFHYQCNLLSNVVKWALNLGMETFLLNGLENRGTNGVSICFTSALMSRSSLIYVWIPIW